MKWKTDTYPEGGRYWWLTVRKRDAMGPEWCFDIDEAEGGYAAVFFWGADVAPVGKYKTLGAAKRACGRRAYSFSRPLAAALVAK